MTERGETQDRDTLCERIAGVPEVRFALVFGSRASEAARPDSDWDVAVYLDDRMDTRSRMDIRVRLAASLEPEYPVDLLILNDAPALAAQRALEGEILLQRDPRAYVHFFVRTLAAAGDEAFWRDLHARERSRRLEEGRFGRP